MYPEFFNHSLKRAAWTALGLLLGISLYGIPAQAAIQGDWNTQADSYRGRNGERITFTFPGGGTTSGRLWGTGTYTDDSSIALAAVHAGLITPRRGGTVTIEILPGQNSYQGSSRNGVTSNGYGSWHGSFRFVDARRSGQDDYRQSRQEDSRHSRQDDYRRSRDDDSRRSRQTARDTSSIPGAWNTQADSYRGQNGQRITFTFPGGGTTSGRLWGTGTYTDDSSIALAAVHAGLITPRRGGTVTIEILPGQNSYQGSSRNGVTSNGYGSWHGSFRFVDARRSGQDDYRQSRQEDSRHSRQDDYRRSRDDDSRRSRQTARDTSSIPGAWNTQADSYRGQNGQRITFTFPGGGTTSGRLWGTGTYTDDSSIALAAVHAGLITPRRGGTVTIEILPGQNSYQGSSRNGVTSNGYGSWHGSFRFVNP